MPAILGEGLADPDPWRGFCLVIEKICELHARDRGFSTALMSAFPTRWISPRTANTRWTRSPYWPAGPRTPATCAPTSSWTT